MSDKKCTVACFAIIAVAIIDTIYVILKSNLEYTNSR
jgi:hypothetical protein